MAAAATDTIETRYQAAIDSGKINGAVLCACASNTPSSFMYKAALGKRTLLSGETQPQRLDDVLYLASATKLVTTIAALQAVEDGLLTLKGDLSSIAPDLVSKQVLTGFDEDDTPLLEPAARPVTLEMLLTHSSGLVYDFMNPLLARWRRRFDDPDTNTNTNTHTHTNTNTNTHTNTNTNTNTDTNTNTNVNTDAGAGAGANADTNTNTEKADADAEGSGDRRPRTRSVEEAFSYPLAFQPGQSWMYGPSLDWAGRIVERATGLPLGEYMQQRIFDPLGITSAQFTPVTRPELRARMVDLNPWDPQGLGHAVLGGNGNAAMNARAGGHFGGHGLFMSGDDYLKILHSLLRGDLLLKPETVRDMFQHHLGPEATAGFQAAVDGPMGAAFRVGIDRGVRLGHGLGGVLTLQDVEGWYGSGTMTWGGGLSLAWFVDRGNGICGVGAVQPSPEVPFDAGVVEALKQVFRKGVYRKYAAWKEGQGGQGGQEQEQQQQQQQQQ